MSIIRFSGLIAYSATTNPTCESQPYPNPWGSRLTPPDNNVMVATHSVIECNILIMCCCMPALYSFLRRVWPEAFDSGSRSQNYRVNSCNLAKSPMPRGIPKTAEHQVSYSPRAGDPDVVEFMDLEERKKEDGCGRW